MMARLPCALALLVTFVSAAGCGGSTTDASGDEATSVDEQNAAATFEGTYLVPTSDPALAAVAEFPVKVKRRPFANGDVRIHYTLPAELVGLPQSVDFEGPANAPRLFSEAGSATCTTSGATETVCHEHLAGISVDLGLVAAKLQTQGLAQSEIDKRLKLASDFGIDPIGVLRFQHGNPGRGGGNGKNSGKGKRGGGD